MKSVYVLQSIRNPKKHYVGLADDVGKRIVEHNAGFCRHSSKWRPWKLKVCVSFRDEGLAVAFEKYLKTGSGRAFAKRHF